MKVRNKGSLAREIAATEQLVDAGGEAEVDDDLGKSLLEQTDVWAAVKAPEKTEESK